MKIEAIELVECIFCMCVSSNQLLLCHGKGLSTYHTELEPAGRLQLQTKHNLSDDNIHKRKDTTNFTFHETRFFETPEHLL